MVDRNRMSGVPGFGEDRTQAELEKYVEHLADGLAEMVVELDREKRARLTLEGEIIAVYHRLDRVTARLDAAVAELKRMRSEYGSQA